MDSGLVTAAAGTVATRNVRPRELKPDSRLTRRELAAELSARDMPIAAGTLAQLASQGAGPPFDKWGNVARYTWGSAWEWALARCQLPKRKQRAAVRKGGAL
jgi:hypothetical protein